jgi:TPR repeat protein
MRSEQKINRAEWSGSRFCANLRSTINAAARRLGSLAVAIILLLAQCALCTANDYDHGLKAYWAGEYQQALKIWQPLAEVGNPDAQYGIGALYDHGRGVRQDDAKAVVWYRKAAEQGHADAQYNLGNMLGDGRGVARDVRLAMHWLHKSADQGIDSAQFNLAMKYHHEPSLRNHEQAAKWYLKAADQNHLNAITNLGVLYQSGLGVVKDDRRAVELYRKAADQGHALAQTHLGDMYHWGRGVKRDDAIAVSWHRRSAEQGDLQGLLNLAFAYSRGLGVPRDLVLAYVFAAHDPLDRKLDLAERTDLAKDLKGRLTDEQRAEAKDLDNAWTIGQPSPTTSRTGRP